MKKVILILATISFAIISCDNNAENKTKSAEKSLTKEDSLYNAVIEGHDEGMMKMRKLVGSQKAVQQALDSLSKTKAKLNTVYIQQLEGLKEELAQAETSMNIWMEEFSPDTLNADKEKRVIYLEAEKAKVGRVNELINTGIQKTDSLIRR